MAYKFHALLSAFVFATVIAGCGSKAEDGDSVQRQAPVRTIHSVEFAGNHAHTDEFLRELVATRVGTVHDAAVVRRDESVLRGLFAAVLETEQVPQMKDGRPTGAVAIVYHVLDRVTVGRLELEGLAIVRLQDVRGVFTTRPGQPLLANGIARDADLLTRLHRDKGYPSVNVRAFRKPTGRPGVEDVCFRVVCGQRTESPARGS